MAKKKPVGDDPDDIMGPGKGHNSKNGSDPIDQYSVTADELRAFIERFEQLAAEKAALTVDMAELMAEAKGRGYDTKILRKVIAIRKRNADEMAEENAVLEMYLTALGMV